MGPFFGCKNLTSVEIPASVTGIGDHAFDGCTSLVSVTIPASVTSIGWDAFAGCDNLVDVTYLSTENQWNEIEGIDDSGLSGKTITFAP